jgi:hypothetical protein
MAAVLVDAQVAAQADEYKNQGNTLFKEGKFADAVDAYSKAIETHGNNVRAAVSECFDTLFYYF